MIFHLLPSLPSLDGVFFTSPFLFLKYDRQRSLFIRDISLFFTDGQLKLRMAILMSTYVFDEKFDLWINSTVHKNYHTMLDCCLRQESQRYKEYCESRDGGSGWPVGPWPYCVSD